MMARISSAKLSPAISHICQISAKPIAALIIASTKPAAVFLGMWIAMKPAVGRTKPCCFMSCQASSARTRGVKAKL